jgi:RNA ligase
MFTDGWLPEECTLLFEIIYPDNRIVVDYGNEEMLVLLAARNTITGEYYDGEFLAEVACRYNFITVAFHSMPQNAQDIAVLVRGWDNGREGVVVEFRDGSRWKFKADAYVQVHRLLSRLSFKRILEAIRDGVIDDTLPLLPPHLQKGVLATMDEIAQVRQLVRERVFRVYATAPLEGTTRGDFARWVMAFHKDISMYLFRLYDNQEIDRDIWKHAFRDYTPQTVILPTVVDDDDSGDK